MLSFKCRKLGLLPPEENLPHSCKRTFQQLWANNGDTISRQYAGTAALKVKKNSTPKKPTIFLDSG